MKKRENADIPHAVDSLPDIGSALSIALLAVVILFAFIVYSPALKLGFYGDDFHYLPTPSIQSVSDLPDAFAYSLKRAPRVISHGIYFVAGRAMFDLNHGAWHVSNFVLYAIAVYILYCFLFAVLRDRLASLAGAGIFALSGILFHPLTWVTGVGELIAAAFAFCGFLLYVKAVRHFIETGKHRVWLEIAALALLAFSLLSKETMLPVFLVLVLIDLFMLGRVSLAGYAAFLMAVFGTFLTMNKFAALQEYHSYSVSFNPIKILGGLLAYFYDTVIAVGGQYWIIDRVGMRGDPGILEDFISYATNNPLHATGIVLPASVLGIFVVLFTIFKGKPGFRHATFEKSLLPPLFGWIAWVSMLFPALLTPGHHYAYYLTVPLGLLMISIAPFVATGLRNPRSRIITVIALVIYIAWFPVNTSLAFKYSSSANGAVRTLEFIGQMKSMYPEMKPGTMVILDKVDRKFDWAINHGNAIEIYYPGTISYSFFNFVEAVKNRPDVALEHDGDVLFFREDNGKWSDVTGEMIPELKEIIENRSIPNRDFADSSVPDQ